MWAWRSSTPTVSPLSLSTFIKHLPFLQLQLQLQLKPLQFRKSILTSALQESQNFESLTPHQHDQVSLYVDALLQWNQKMNLTAVKDKTEVMERHVHDSFAIIPSIRDSYASLVGSSCDSINLVDVGSGAGLPGLILGIACPGWKVTLMESLNKRCLFLEHAIAVTGLTNVKVVRGRAESFGQSAEFREAFDVAVARAVAEMRVLAEYCLPLVRVGGLFVAAKGHDPSMEVKSAEKVIGLLGASLFKQCSVESYGPFGQRTAIVCFKQRRTPTKYPRQPGTPAKIPL